MKSEGLDLSELCAKIWKGLLRKVKGPAYMLPRISFPYYTKRGKSTITAAYELVINYFSGKYGHRTQNTQMGRTI